MTVLIIFGGFLTLIILYLVIIIFFPIMNVESQPVAGNNSELNIPGNRENVSFSVEKLKISAYFYKTDKSETAPCIIMNHGFCGTKDMSLEQYALKFNKSGYSVLTFDYRYFGESEGQPRQLFCGPYQIEDLKAAVNYAISREDVDKNNIILWGTSAGASYGLIIASGDSRITGIISQCGSFDHKEDEKAYWQREGIGFFVKLFIHGQRDKGRSRFGLSPHTFPAYGKPGTIAMITAPGAFEGIEKLAMNSRTFINETCARLSLLPHAPDPVKLAPYVRCPVLIQVCSRDSLVSPRSHVRLLEKLKSPVVLKEYPINHFDIYSGEYFDVSTDDQLQFLRDTVIS